MSLTADQIFEGQKLWEYHNLIRRAYQRRGSAELRSDCQRALEAIYQWAAKVGLSPNNIVSALYGHVPVKLWLK